MITTTDTTTFNPEMWTARLMARIDQTSVLLPLVDRAYEGDLRVNKQVVVKGEKLETFTIGDGEYFAFSCDDIGKAQSDHDTMDRYLKRVVIALNNQINAKIIKTILTNASTEVVSGPDAFPTAFKFARSALNGLANDGQRWAIVDDEFLSQSQSRGWPLIPPADFGDTIVQSALVGGKEILRTANQMPGFIGQMRGFNFYTMKGLANIAGGRCFLFGTTDAIHFVSQITECESIVIKANEHQAVDKTAVKGLMLHDTYVSDAGRKRLVSVSVKA